MSEVNVSVQRTAPALMEVTFSDSSNHSSILILSSNQSYNFNSMLSTPAFAQQMFPLMVSIATVFGG